MYLGEPLSVPSASAKRQRLRVWTRVSRMALVNASAKRPTMSSIETLLRQRLLVPAPSLLPVSGLGKLAVLVSTRASRRLLLACCGHC
ncbi:hypothetical protein V8C34DRAFT_275154 [Trichoderma compactum]